MFKHLLSLTCMTKKEKKKLAIAASSPQESVSTQNTQSPGSSGSSGPDDTLNRSVAIQIEEDPLETSQFMSKVLSDASFDAANLQNRATPIDFATKEVRGDDDVLSVVGRRRSVNTITPSPIPEETEDNLTETITSPTTLSEVPGKENIFEPVNNYPLSVISSPPHKPRKLAEIYNADEASPSASSSSNNDDSYRIDSVKVRASKSSINQRFNPRLTPILGGSLRPTRAKRHSVAFHENTKVYQLDRRNSGSCMFSFRFPGSIIAEKASIRKPNHCLLTITLCCLFEQLGACRTHLGMLTDDNK